VKLSRCHQPRLRHGRRGLTLIEIVIVLAIIAIAVTALAVSMSSSGRAELKKTEGLLGAAMRNLYHLAVVNNRPYRLVIDMDGNSFWGEALTDNDPCKWYVSTEEERAERSGGSERGIAADPEDTDQRLRASFSKTKQGLLAPRKMPKRIRVTGVITDNLAEIQTGGTATIHFFPGGRAERAYIWLGEKPSGEESEAVAEHTLAISSLMGQVTLHYEELTPGQFFTEGHK
jgi:general secretion pathway protein H